MLTFEKVQKIFEDYLAIDKTIEVYKSRYGCVRVEFDEDLQYCTGEVCLYTSTVRFKLDFK